MKMHSKLWTIAFVFYGLLITWGSLQPAAGQPPIPHLDKLMHFIGYGVFATLGIMACCSKRQVVMVFIFVVVWGAFIEYLQSLTPTRMMSIADFVANSFGAAIAVWLLKSRIAILDTKAKNSR